MVMAAASPAVPLEEGGRFCSSINLTIAPAIDVRSLFLFEEFFVLLALIILPAFVRASRTCMGGGGVMPSSFWLGGAVAAVTGCWFWLGGAVASVTGCCTSTSPALVGDGGSGEENDGEEKVR